MKITRPDLTSMILTAVCVVGIVALALFRIPIPDVLTYVAIGALGIGGGTALNASSPTDSAAQRIAESLASLEQLIGGARRSSPTPAPRPSAPAQPIPAQPAAPTAAAAGSTPVGTR